MAFEARLLAGLFLALGLAYVATPVAIRVAARLNFYDRPAGYKGHARPTPYLGGAAVVTGFLVAALLLGGSPDRTLPLLGGIVAMWAVGTIDDRRNIPPLPRVLIEGALAVGLWALGLGWDLGIGPALDLVVTIVWIIAVVNAFNLFDNMDGATGTMAAVVAAVLAFVGVLVGDVWLAMMGIALCGACLGFLPHNLANPSRIFLGDGGSMPIGFAVAALVMVATSSVAAAWQALAMGLLLVGVPALDTTLVVVSRYRRKVPILTGGRDHLTHRTRQRLHTARAVAVALGGAQALLATLAVVAAEGGPHVLIPLVLGYLIATAFVIVMLDAVRIRTRAVTAETGSATVTRPVTDVTHAELVPEAKVADVARRALPPVAVVVAPLAFALGLSAFLFGLYSSHYWAPLGLVLLAALVAAVIARPASLTRPALLCVAGLGGLAGWALASAGWGTSAEQALVAGNRFIVLAAMLALLAVLIRTPRDATWALASVTGGIAVVALWSLTKLLLGDAGAITLSGRLSEPLGYVNAQGSFFVLGVFPALALAERARRAPLAGIGAAGATWFAALALMSQSRGAAIGALAGCAVVLAVAPGRRWRIAMMVLLGVALAVAAGDLLSVYEHRLGGGRGLEDAGRNAGRAIIAAAVAVGLVWTAIRAGIARLDDSTRRFGQRLWTAAIAAVVVVAMVGGLVNAGRIHHFAGRQYDAFVSLEATQSSGQGSTRLLSGGGKRYDYWRIAMSAWRSDKLVGVGAGGYDVPYYAQRRTTEDIQQPHSLPLQTLAELGLVGGALLLLFLAGMVWAVVHGARRARANPAEVGLLVAGAGMSATWLAHTSVDWLHLLPGVTGVAFVGLAVLLSRPSARAAVQRPTRLRWRRPRFLPAVAVALLLGFAGVSLGQQVLSERYRDRAQDALAADPAQALKLANSALRLDADDVSVLYVKAAALARFGQGAPAERVLLEAIRREPSNFVTYTLLGDLRVRRGELKGAKRAYGRAHALNPRDPALIQLARNGHP